MDKSKTISVMITEKEANLLKLIRDIGYGKMVIHIEGGHPTRAEEIRKSVKF